MLQHEASQGSFVTVYNRLLGLVHCCEMAVGTLYFSWMFQRNFSVMSS